jgi:ABC-type multidrug transport system fused ATPase/permease subunit
MPTAKNTNNYFYIIGSAIFVTLFFWLIFYFNLPRLIGFPSVNLETLFANYDGPNYLIVSKCGYNHSCITSNFSLPQPAEYYAAHLPGYPALISLFNLLTTGPKAMLISTLLGSVLLQIVFYRLASLYFTPKKSLLLSLIFLVLPARFLVLRFIGAPETWFLALTISSIINYKKKRYLLSAVLAAFSVIFKSPGIILFGAYGVLFLNNYLKNHKFNFNYLTYLLIPISAIGVFFLYYIQTGDFLAYFHSGDNIHLNPLPFLVFISTNKIWVNTIWLEDIIYIYFLGLIGIRSLYARFKINILTVYPALFLLAGLLVAHRDISRYLSPIYPFLILAFGKYLTRKSTLIVIALIVPACLLYAINFAIGNVAPVSNWGPFL